MSPLFRRVTLLACIPFLALLLLAETIIAADPIVLSEREADTIADLVNKNQIRFGDASRTAYVDPGLWYAIDWQQKKNLTILLARRLAATNKADFSSIAIVSSLTGRKLATFSMFEGFSALQ